MSDERPSEQPRRRSKPTLVTSITGQARVEKLVNVAEAENVFLGAHMAPQALFQLPADIPDFVGRDALLGELVAHLQRAPAQEQSAGARVALHGPPGVGKSALAIRLAHAVKGAFPDAQLYVNLGAGAGMPLAPAEALAGFLRALGVEGLYPESEDQRAAFYRAQLDGKRALVVLDNARDLAQIRALLPGSPGCAVIVTSRRPLGILEGAHSHKVDVLAPDAAVELLGEIVGSQRIEAEREAALRLTRLCGELPLAVRIAGGQLKNNTHHTLTWMADRLEDEHSRLGELASEDQAVLASFMVSYEELVPEEARLFCLLAALPGPDFSTGLAAGATEADIREMERLLDRLVEAQMLEANADRYRLHDLIRLFAGERLDTELDLDRQAIVTRAANWLCERAEAADLALGAGDSRHTDALTWLEAERRSLVAAIEASHAARNRHTGMAMTSALTDFFSLRSHWDDWTRTYELALRSAREAGDRQSEGQTLNNLAIVYRRQSRWDEAITNYERALAICREFGDRLGEGQTLNNLANVYNDQGRWDEAITNYKQALAICRDLGDRLGEGQTLGNLANVYNNQGRWDEAITNYEQDLMVCRELGDRLGEGQTLNNLAALYSNQGRWAEAIPNYEQALAVRRELGDRRGEGLTLGNLGLAERRSGDAVTGERHIREAIELLDALGSPNADRVRAWLTVIEEPPTQ
jgi:tetratricopeptide (TPR) repeat protein